MSALVVRRLASAAALTLVASGGLAAAPALTPAASAAPTSAAPTSATRAAAAVPTGPLQRYIVQLSPSRDVVPSLARTLVAPFGGQVLTTFDTVLNGFSVVLPSSAAALVRALPGVTSVRQDVDVRATDVEPGATYGIDRIDQRALPLSGSYSYPSSAGQNSNLYVIDTGINPNHSEFTGRVGVSRNFVAGGLLGIGTPDPAAWTDCNGHGTHVSSTAAGTVWGVAKKATIHAIRVLNCQGSGSGTAIIAGMDWVAQNHGPNAVANMSLGSTAVSADIDAAAARLVSSGVALAVAAGNDNKNACTTSPAAAPSVLTVGATTKTDARASFSNFGTCVDLFAPGDTITAASYSTTSGSTTMSGTSMASPHVAGVLALVRTAQPGLSAAAAQQLVADGATPGVVTDPGSGSPNKLLYNGVATSDPNVDSAPTAAFTVACTGLACSFNASGSSDDRGIASYAWSFGDGATATGVTANRTYAAGTYTVRLTVTDTAGQTGTTTTSVTVASTPCSTCTRYDGTLAAGATATPAGSFTGSGVLKGFLRGPAGANFDLALQKQSCVLVLCSWSTVASSTSSGSAEDVSYTAASGTYRWVVTAVAGSGAYSFWKS